MTANVGSDYRVKFTPSKATRFYHDLTPNDKGEVMDFGFKALPNGEEIELALEKNVNAVQAVHLVTQFPDHFKLVKGDLDKARKDAAKIQILALDSESPGAAGALQALRKDMASMKQIIADQSDELGVLRTQLSDYQNKMVVPEKDKGAGSGGSDTDKK